MAKFGIISDTHVKEEDDVNEVKNLIERIKRVFNNVDVILHAGDVVHQFFLIEIEKIAPVKCVAGNMDNIVGLESFIKFTAGRFNIGMIHISPDSIEHFFKEHDLHILIHGHTHQPVISELPFNALLLNPGSPTRPIAPPQKFGFNKPIARRTVMTLEIDEQNDLITTYIVNI